MVNGEGNEDLGYFVALISSQAGQEQHVRVKIISVAFWKLN